MIDRLKALPWWCWAAVTVVAVASGVLAVVDTARKPPVPPTPVVLRTGPDAAARPSVSASVPPTPTATPTASPKRTAAPSLSPPGPAGPGKVAGRFMAAYLNAGTDRAAWTKRWVPYATQMLEDGLAYADLPSVPRGRVQRVAEPQVVGPDAEVLVTVLHDGQSAVYAVHLHRDSGGVWSVYSTEPADSR